MQYAMVKENKIDNIIECDNYTIAQMMKNELNMDYAIGIELFSVSIGDIYDNGKFYDGKGNEIQRQLTDPERITMLEVENIELKQSKVNLEQTVLTLMTQVAQLKVGGAS
ncbi:hypothetical protein [Vallitalea guaymasensis]|uniref:Uncharacterized protein n=1 Tax=Vallitalea guaymasensis TaxID=1185412 RepID=A0A8J8MC01_9FIRM|nr:hypothetical protein [Vallitalea guaymasensis]QUH29998.1 hypothetical protein HYG85_14175 [Vallitalea guaymasensis]